MMVKKIEPHGIDLELQGNGSPLLVAFLKRNERYMHQSRVLDNASRKHAGKLRCYLYDADYLKTAFDRFMVRGTPTFLFFSKGEEVARLIGESDQETLDDFIDRCIQRV